MTFWETVARGEYVMIALAVVLIATLWIWWARAAKLSRQYRDYEGMLHRLHDYISEGDIESAQGMCSAISSPGALSVRKGLALIGSPMDRIRSEMDEIEKSEGVKMERGVSWLKGLAIMAPLAGAAGTLCGICDRLRDLGNLNTEITLSNICENIAPCIVTTIVGLGVGIFSIVAWISLDGRVIKSKRKLAEVGREFREILNSPS